MQSAFTKYLLVPVFLTGFSGSAAAAADVGGITLGMKSDDAVKIMTATAQGGNGRVGKVNFTLTFDRAQNKSGTFTIYTATWHNQQAVGEMLVGISPLTGTVWSITKSENPQAARPALQAIANAAAKFGKVNAGAVTSTEYIQRWMYNGKGGELEWSNAYDKPQNGNCFASTQAAPIAGTELWFPVQPTSACSTIYWVNAKSASHDGAATSYSSVAVDIAAFREWFQSVDVNKQKQIEQEKNSAAKPQL